MTPYIYQIQELQSQLTQKDDVIFELEASAATSHAESKHCIENAERKVHLVEEELRRTRQEANSYKSSFLRQKKRVAELESQKNRSGSGNRDHSGGNYHAIDNSRLAASLSTWGEHGLHQPSGPSIQHDHHSPVELRKVTPSISNEEQQQEHETSTATNQNLTMADDTHNNDSVFDERPMSGSKRKTLKQLANNIANGTDVVGKHMQQPVNRGNTNVCEDSVRQRMAKHLLNREEMGCYSLHMGGDISRACDISSAMIVESTQHEGKEDEDGMASVVQQLLNDKALQQDMRKEQETQTLVKSILYQMVDAPEHTLTGIPVQGNLSVSGLVNVLLVRFNSLFHRKSTEDNATVDKDGDHVMENATNNNTSDKCNIEYQRMALAIESDESSTGVNTYTTVSWRAGLYLLRVIHDILLLSGNARDDLRWWLYQARQSSGGGVDGSSLSNTRSPSSEVSGGGEKGDSSHSRIEGLPTVKHNGQSSSDRKEALWTRNCLQSSLEQSLPWDPMTMTQPCNIFFELLVGLMKGNVFEQSKTSTRRKESTRDNGLEQTLVQLVQLKAIDLVLALMSDAAPHDHAKDCQGNRTPYLWKFWFDALIPGTLTPSSNAVAIGDFLSPWEKRDGSSCTDTSLGSGRKHSTRLLADDSSSNANQQQSKKGAEKQGRAVKGGARGTTADSAKTVERPKPRGRLPDLIKGRILQLLSHFVLSSSSVYQSLYEIVDEETKSSLGKRILAAVLDHLEECIVPYLLSSSSVDITTQTAEQCLQLCSTCIQFLLIMSRSNEGIRMLRLQMRLESEQDETSRWSQSAIGCVTSVLDGTLSFAATVEEEKGEGVTKFKCTNLSRLLNTVAKQCVVFFKTLLQFVEQQRGSSSKATTFSALTSEHRTIFQSCCQRILAHQSPTLITDPHRLLNFSEGLKDDVISLMEELVIDAEKEN